LALNPDQLNPDQWTSTGEALNNPFVPGSGLGLLEATRSFQTKSKDCRELQQKIVKLAT
jgi:hypothetical protein